jgi:ssDNA-binding Zn-finger/Zn-ribbon topoisomerase 1
MAGDKSSVKPKSSISMTLDKRTVERLRLLRKIDQKVYGEIVEKLNLAMLPVITEAEKDIKINKNAWRDAKVCPKCESGVLMKRFRRSDKKPFLSCHRFPECRHTEDI